MAAEDYFYDEDPYRDDAEVGEVITRFEILRETEKALHVKTKQGTFWIPKAACELGDSYLSVYEWFDIEYQSPVKTNSKGFQEIEGDFLG